jgi:hypothetical protein
VRPQTRSDPIRYARAASVAGCIAARAAQDRRTPKINWSRETRIFEDRRRVIKFACEVPTAIDQRLFALGRTIQQEME